MAFSLQTKAFLAIWRAVCQICCFLGKHKYLEHYICVLHYTANVERYNCVLHYNKRESNSAIWVVSKGWDLTVCWQCWDSLVSLHIHVCACSAIGLDFVCSVLFTTTLFCLKLAHVNWVAGGTKRDCWSLSSKCCWTCHLPSLLWWSSSKS